MKIPKAKAEPKQKQQLDWCNSHSANPRAACLREIYSSWITRSPRRFFFRLFFNALCEYLIGAYLYQQSKFQSEYTFLSNVIKSRPNYIPQRYGILPRLFWWVYFFQDWIIMQRNVNKFFFKRGLSWFLKSVSQTSLRAPQLLKDQHKYLVS